MNFPTYTITPRTQWFSQKVVGTRHYMHVVQHIVSQVPQSSDAAHLFDVTLVIEPDNPHITSRHAISVRFDDHVIGYIPESDAEKYWSELAIIAVNGLRPATKAKLVNSGDIYGPNPKVEVTLALPAPGLIIPANEPPISTYALLPWGDAIQVTRESDHFDQLQHYLANCSETLLLVSLHAITEDDRKFVEVRLDGARVGELTMASSSHLLTAIEHLDRSGLLTVCRAQLSGSQLGAQLTLYVAKGHEMGADVVHPEISPLGRLDERTVLGVPNAWQGDTTTPLPQSAPRLTPRPPTQQYAVPPLQFPTPTPPMYAPPQPPTQQFAAPPLQFPTPTPPMYAPPQPVIHNMTNNVGQQNVFIGNAMPQYATMHPAPQKDIAVAYALWLFLGIFGVHRMYLRDYTGGVIQLFTAGGAGIWWLIDIALIPGLVNRRNQGF